MRNRSSWLVAPFAAGPFFLGLLIGASSIPGCSSKSEDAKSADSSKRPSVAPGDAGKGGRNSVVQTQSRRGFWTDAKGRKHFHNIPYDIFYEDAYEVARDKTLVGTSVKGTKSPAGKVAKKSGAAAKGAPKSADDWKSLISMAVLEAETKNIRNFMKGKMQSVSRYNGGYKQIQSYGSTLAAVAHIISQHPDPLSWKEDAPYLRDIGKKLNETAIGLAKVHYNATKIPFEQFLDIMDRNKPAGLMKPEEGVTFEKCASRGGLMKRMDEAHKWLSKEVRDETTFKGEAEKVLHEAMILAALSKVIADSSYESTDEKEYKTYAQNLIKASTEMASAVQVGNFINYRTAVDRIINQCNNCHSDYR